MNFEELVESKKSIGNMTKEELFTYCNGLLDEIWDFEKEIGRLNNIINELEKWYLSQKENDKYCYLASNDKDKCRYDIWEEVLNKLQELKGEDNE